MVRAACWVLGMVLVASGSLASAAMPDWLRLISDSPECAPAAPTLFRWQSDVEPSGDEPGLDEPLCSDRPDFTESACTLGRGVVQLEMGYTYLFDDNGLAQVHAHSYPETLLRVGVLAEWLEVRVGWTYAADSLRGVPGTNDGHEDLYVGMKLGLTQQQGILPEMAIMPQMTLPTGSRIYTNDRVLPGVNWLYSWEINEFLSTGGSSQINLGVDGESRESCVAFAQSWTVGYSLTDRLGAFTEWYMITPSGADTMPTEHYFDGGFTYSVTNDLQLDIRAGKGLSDGAIDYFTGAGVVVRF
jgi:hypothetical protein